MSAPAMNVLPAPMMTMALTAVVAGRPIESGLEAVDDVGTERVDGWVVDANERDALVDAERNGLIHRCRPGLTAGNNHHIPPDALAVLRLPS